MAKQPLIRPKSVFSLLLNLFLAFQNLLVGLLVLLAAAHLLLPDRPLFLAMVTMMTRYLYLPAYPLLVTGLLTKKRGVWGAAACVALLHLIWIAPDYTPARRVAAAGPALRILSVNLYYYNPQIEDLIAEIKAVDADVIFLQEAFRPWWQALEDNELFTLYPYQVDRLAPLNLPRRPTRPVSYYAFFKGWLLLSQPPGCLCLPTSFPT